MTHVKFWRGVFVLLFVFITYLTVTPNPEDTQSGMAFTRWLAKLFLGQEAYGDKVAHFTAYASLAGVGVFAQLKLAGRMSLTILALALYGASLEGVQSFMGVRQPELADAIANASGVIIAFPLALMVRRLAGAKGAADAPVRDR